MIDSEEDRGAPREDEFKECSGFKTAEALVREDGRLHTVPITGGGKPEIPEDVCRRWIKSLTALVKALGMSAGLVMRAWPGGIQVFLRAGDPGEKYAPGALFPFGTGSYCESALGLGRMAIYDFAAEGAGAGGYCGIPLRWPDGSFFGTLCLISGDSAPDGTAVGPLVEEICASMEKDLELLHLRQYRDKKYEKYARAMEALLQYSPGGIFSYSAEEDEQFSFVSENMLAFLGYTKEEFAAKFQNRFSLMVYAGDRARTLREIDEQTSRGPFDSCEYRIEKGDGTLAWVHDEGHIVADETGKRWFYVVIVDITENMRAQEAEREKYRAAMQSLLDANPQAMGALRLNLTKNTCGEGHWHSRAAREAIVEKTADGFFSNVASRITDPDGRRDFLAAFDREKLAGDFSAGRSSVSFDYERFDDRGRPVWVRMYLKMLTNPDTGDTEGVVFSQDVSREKRRDGILSLITSQEYDLIALLHLDTGMVEAYFIGQTLPAAYRELLPAPGAVYGLEAYHEHAVREWLHPDDIEKYRQCSDPAYFRPVMDEKGRFEFVLRERFPDVEGGEMFRKFQHYYLDGDRDTILVIESDVSQTCRRQQQELERAQAEAGRVKDIMDSIATGICELHMPDAEHLTVEYVNMQMFRMLGFEPGINDISQLTASSEQLVLDYRKNAFSGVHPDDLARVKRIFRENYGSDYFVVDNYRTRGSGGKYFWIKEEVRLREVTPEYRVFYATYHDVGEEVRLNGELKEQLREEKRLRREATAANAAKTDFLSRMSHDIRTPLNGIIGMTYLALEEDNPPRTADCLAKIDTSSKFLLGLINDVLDMSRAESDRIELNPEPYPIGEYNEYLDAVIRPLCREKGQSFMLDESLALDQLVPLADKLRTNQIMFNLLSNAVKYTPEGGTITYRISGVSLGDGRVAVEHRITDTGIGMSGEFQKVLFQPFSQEARDDNSETRGSGLGLAIVKKLVDLMGGTIRVRSEIGKGTTFLVRLEFDAIPGESALRPRQAAGENGSGAGALAGKHILLCEDHPLNQEIVKALLEQKGAMVEIAVNGRRGVDLFAASAPGYYDAVLMDIRMPVMDGITAAGKIRAMKRADAARVPIVAMTADAFEEDVQKCLNAGMNSHLAKPIDPELLFRTLAELGGGEI
jgi:PAS domain S-box-containing protein